MFNPTREQVREMFFSAWRKYREDRRSSAWRRSRSM